MIGIDGIEEEDIFKIEAEIERILRNPEIDDKLFEGVVHQVEFEAKKTVENKGLGYLS